MAIIIRVVIPIILYWMLIVGIGVSCGMKWGVIFFILSHMLTPIVILNLSTNVLGRVRFAYVYALAVLGISCAQGYVALHYWNGWFVSSNKCRAQKWF